MPNRRITLVEWSKSTEAHQRAALEMLDQHITRTKLAAMLLAFSAVVFTASVIELRPHELKVVAFTTTLWALTFGACISLLRSTNLFALLSGTRPERPFLELRAISLLAFLALLIYLFVAF